MTPYYQQDGITIYHGDSREVLPSIGAGAVVCITDPVWPNLHPDLQTRETPEAIFYGTLEALPGSLKTLCVWLGCQSDPRFLAPLTSSWPFLRMCYLRRAVPSYNGRCLVSGEVLYCFGEWPPSRKGARVLPGEFSATSKPKLKQAHPCPRNSDHAAWVVKWWGYGTVLDPFSGTGTILLAAKNQGISAIGIEIEERYCEIAAQRLGQRIFEMTK